MQLDRTEFSDARNQLENALGEFGSLFRRFHILKITLFVLIYVLFVVSIIYPIYVIFLPSSVFVETFWCITITSAIFFGVKLLKHNYKFAKKMSMEDKAKLVESKFAGHENLIVNSLQLSGHTQKSDGFENAIADKITKEAVEFISSKRTEFNSKINWIIVRRLSLILAALVLTFSSTIAFAGTHVLSAMKHFLTLGYLLDDFAISASMAETLDWEIIPMQDVEIVKGGDLEINAIPDNTSYKSAFIYDTINEDNENRHAMSFNGNTYLFTYRNIQGDFRYFVASGHERTRIINVKVYELPEIDSLSLRIKYPEYTQKNDDVIDDFNGDIIAVENSVVTLHLRSTQELKKAQLLLNKTLKTMEFIQSAKNSREYAINLLLKEDDAYNIKLVNKEKRTYVANQEGQIRVLPDLLPQIKILSPTQTSIQQSINTALPLSLRVFDDFGISQIKMIVEHSGKSIERILFNSFNDKRPSQQMSAKFALELLSTEYKVGEVVKIYFEASDNNPNRTFAERFSKSKTIEIQIIEQNQIDNTSEKLLNDVITRLNALLSMQRITKDKTERTIKWINKKRSNKIIHEAIMSIVTNQKEVRAELLNISKIADVDEFPSKETPRILEKLAGGAAYEIIRLLDSTLESAENHDDPEMFTEVLLYQAEIIEELTALLETLRKKNNLDPDLGKSKENLDLSRKVQEKLENLKSKLDEFKKDQKRIIELTKELGKKAEEDWTEEDDKIWEECKQAEDDWAKFFEDMRNDLSKLPDQDFSCSEVTDELNQIYQEVRNATDEVVKKNITIAVTREEAGLEKAEELENNLERWLSDTRDYIKWEMEEPTEDYDIPLSDLPDELEDIIGDLIDEEEDITDEVDDASSSWMDNLDKGAGWDALDGPISNMSAKGVTGNQMPNSSEIGGRSGEGRTGRSSGQYVTKEATGGRGGRKTPTRDDGTAPETGQVKDKSNDEIGGATGGGKLSGDGGQGVRGEGFPELKETMRRLQGKQADVLNRAEKLKRELEKRRYPTEVLDKTIEIMRMVDSQLRDFSQHSPDDVKDRILKIVTQLKQADTSVKDAAKLYQDLTRALPKEVRDQVTSAQDEKSPEKYKDLLDNYYRQLLKSK